MLGKAKPKNLTGGQARLLRPGDRIAFHCILRHRAADALEEATVMTVQWPTGHPGRWSVVVQRDGGKPTTLWSHTTTIQAVT